MTLTSDWQFELNGLTFGNGTRIRVFAMDHEKPEIRVRDSPIPGANGIRMGKDFLGGTGISLTFGIDGGDAEGALTQLAALRSAWGREGHERSGSVQELRYRRPDGTERVVYGRPREFSPASLENVASGYIPVEAKFQAVDELFYSGQPYSLTLTLLPVQGGGLTIPFTLPATLAPADEAPGMITNAGDAYSWITVTFTGPVSNPKFTYTETGQSLKLQRTIGNGVNVAVDTRPWKRTVTRVNDGASFAGDVRGTRLSDLGLPPGNTVIAFRGEDATGHAKATFEWRDAYTSF